MTTYEEKLPPTKSSKHSGIRWTPCPEDFSPRCGKLVIDTDRSRTTYIVTEFPVSWPGRGFQLVKVEGGSDTSEESYSVFASHHGPEADSCECRGATYHPEQPCKHQHSIRALISNGWI